MTEIRVAAVAGSLGSPSRTHVLAAALVSALAEQARIEASLVEIARLAPSFAAALQRAALPADVEAALRRVEQADIVIVATPVYRGSYAGLFKHFFDLIDQEALADVPVILAATGGSERHALVLEHALRPLFSFFRARTVPTALYASDADFEGRVAVNGALIERARVAARQALQLVRPAHNSPATREGAVSTLS